MLRRFETLLTAHTFVETTVDFTLGDVLHTAISVAIYAKSYMREKAGIQHLVDRLPRHAMLYRGDAGELSGALTDSSHPCLVSDPVDFPGLAPIIRERLLKVGRIRGDIRPNKSNQD
jgi:hypothetical protein